MDRREPSLHDVHTELEVLKNTSRVQYEVIKEKLDGLSSKLDASIEAQSEEKAKSARTAGIVALVVTVLGFLLESLIRHAG